MKILVTGGAGYIGSVLVPALLQRQFAVRVYDNLMYGGTGLLPHFGRPGFEFVAGDVREEAKLRDAVRDCDAVIHLAAIVGFPACRKNPELAESVNHQGSITVARAAGRGRLVLFGSTGSNYGTLESGVCTEDSPLNPLSLYGKSKTAAERHLLENCDTIAYRFATAFGLSPRLRLDLLVNDFVYTALKLRYLVVYESHFMRTFIHVRDIAQSFLFALDHAAAMKGNVYNVGGNDMNYSKAEVCELIRKHVDYYLHFAEVGEDADRRNYVVSYEKINALGFHTTVTLERGIADMVQALQVIQVQNPYSNA